MLCLLTLLSPFWAAFPEIYGVAGFFFALGVASRLVPALERRSDELRRLVRGSFPLVASAVPVLALSLWGIDRHKASRQEARPLPPPGSPNVLLIVLDTVGADHLSVYGYKRPTSPTLEELAQRANSLRASEGDFIFHAAVSCKHVYRTMASRTFRRLDQPA